MAASSARLDRDRNLGELLEDALSIYRRHAAIALLLTAAVVVPVELVVSGIGLGQLGGGYDATPSGGEVAMGALVSLLVTSPLVTGMLMYIARADGHDEPVTARSAAVAGLEAFAPLLVTVLLYTLGVLLGLIALIIPGVILAIRWSVVAPVVVIEGRSGAEALRRSWELVTGNSWWVLAALIVQGIVVAVIGGLVSLPADAIARSADAQAVSLAAAVVVQIVTLPFTAFVTALLFFTLRARRGEIGVPPAPQFGAPAERPEEPSLWGRESERPENDDPGPQAPGGWEPPVPPR